MAEVVGRSPASQGRACAPSGLSRDASQAEPLVPNAGELFDAVANQFSSDMGLALSGWRLRRNYQFDKGDIRSAAVASVDGCHGYTCEFSSCPSQHIAEYDALERLLTDALADAGAQHER